MIILIILGILLLILMVITLHSVSSANQKLKRLRRRYDHLLRGRGELNLEELVLGFEDEMAVLVKRLKEREVQDQNLEERLHLFDGVDLNAWEQRLATLERGIDPALDQLREDLQVSVRSVQEQAENHWKMLGKETRDE